MINKRKVFIPIGPSIAYVPLTQGYWSVIEIEDVCVVSGINWCAHVVKEGAIYAVGQNPETKRLVQMHKLLLCVDPDSMVDHANKCSLDNRRMGNLREANRSQNGCNRKSSNALGILGIRKIKDRYQARVSFQGQHFRKTYETLPEAVAARNAAATAMQGKFASITHH